MARTAVIIVAGGGGKRMGGALPKQFRMLTTEPILCRTINRFHEALPEAQLIVVLPDEHIPFWENLKARFEVARHTVVSGGAERFDSVKNGLKAVGYDGAISIEHEDALMSPKEGLEKAIALLKNTIIYEQPGQMWWA